NTIQQVQRAAAQAKALTPNITRQHEIGQADLVEQATYLDPDGLRQVAKRWSEYSVHAYEQASQPDDEVLARTRGSLYRGEVLCLRGGSPRVDSLFHECLRVLASVVNSSDPSSVTLKRVLDKLLGATLPDFTSPVPAPKRSHHQEHAHFS